MRPPREADVQLIGMLPSVPPGATAGLLGAIAFAKDKIARFRRGWCPEREAAEPPRKRLKAEHLPMYASCVIGGALGLKEASC